LLDRFSGISYIRSPSAVGSDRTPYDNSDALTSLLDGVDMASSQSAKSSKFFRPTATGAFDQYLLEIQKLPMIGDPEEEKRLARRAQKGDPKAAERLVTANLRFVISYVKKYQGHGLDLSELVAIGNEGLLKAVKKFDPEHGVKFISYAVWWVRQAVLKALAEQTRSTPPSGRMPSARRNWGASRPTARSPWRSTTRWRTSGPRGG